MKDYSELKKLAEEFPEGLDFDSNNEPFFNGPSGESLGGGSTGFYSVYGKPFLIDGDDYEYDGPTYVEACNVEFAKFMVAARDGVLELISEIDRLNEEYDKAWRHDMNDKNNVQVLAAEVVTLRKDAARYRWLRDNNFDIGSFHPAHEHNHQSWFEYFDDESIDYNLSMESK